MARTGRFGRLPRAVPSLTNTLLAIAREMENQRDQNVMDAWQKGGLFEGQPATDERVLAYWRKRLAGVSKDDPLYDTYSNLVTQYEYNIAESKMRTKNDQGKLSDTQAAQFYLNWAKKVPKDTEFYRVLQRDAAQFMQNAKARGAAFAAQAKAKAYADSQQATYDRYEKPGDYIQGVVANMMRASGKIGMTEDLSNFTPDDPSAVLGFINKLGTAADNTVLYTPVGQSPVTVGDVKAQLKTYDPAFNGTINLSAYEHYASQGLKGKADRLDRANRTGHVSEADGIRKEQAQQTEDLRQSQAWPVDKLYFEARQQFIADSQAAHTPDQQIAARDRYLTRIAGYVNDPANPVDDNTRARITAEVNGDTTVESLGESLFGFRSADHTAGGTGATGDIAESWQGWDQYQAEADAVKAGQAIYTMGTRDSKGIFQADPKGTDVGAIDGQDIVNAQGQGATMATVTQGPGLPPLQLLVTPMPIKAVMHDANGKNVPAAPNTSTTVGYMFNMPVDGVSTPFYKIEYQGKTYVTRDNPYGQVPMAPGPNGTMEMDLSAAAQPGVAGVGYSNGAPVMFDPGKLAEAADAPRFRSGANPKTDIEVVGDPSGPGLSFALMVAAVKSSRNEATDPTVVQQLFRAARAAATDPVTGVVDEFAASAMGAIINRTVNTGVTDTTDWKGANAVNGPPPMDSETRIISLLTKPTPMDQTRGNVIGNVLSGVLNPDFKMPADITAAPPAPPQVDVNVAPPPQPDLSQMDAGFQRLATAFLPPDLQIKALAPPASPVAKLYTPKTLTLPRFDPTQLYGEKVVAAPPPPMKAS